MRVSAALIVAVVLPLAGCTSPYGLSSPGAGDPAYITDSEIIYRTTGGRYYCLKPDGKRGRVSGSLSGNALANVIEPGSSKTLGEIMTEDIDRLAVKEIDRSSIRCE